MSGPSSGALKGGVSLKAILAENIQDGGCLSAFTIRTWWRTIIAVKERHLQKLNFTFFHVYWILLSLERWLCSGQKQIFLPAKEIPSSYMNPFEDIHINMHCSKSPNHLSECQEIEATVCHLRDLTYPWKLLQSSWVLCIYGHELVLLSCYCILFVSSTKKWFIQFISDELYCCRVVN